MAMAPTVGMAAAVKAAVQTAAPLPSRGTPWQAPSHGPGPKSVLTCTTSHFLLHPVKAKPENTFWVLNSTFWGPIWDPPLAVLPSNKHLLRTGRAYFPWRGACPPKWCCMVTLGCHAHDRPPDWLPPSMRRCPAAPGLTQRALLPAGAALPANGDPEPLPDGHRLTDLDTLRAITVWHRLA